MNETQFTNELHYQVSSSLVRTMIAKHILTADEGTMIDAALCERYKPCIGGLVTEPIVRMGEMQQ